MSGAVRSISNARPASTVSILFHPGIVPLLDVFRMLRRLEEQCDLSMLEGPERELAVSMRPELAKTIVSDALLLGFALKRQRGRPLCHRIIGSRFGSRDEYCLSVMIGTWRGPAAHVSREAAGLLGIGALETITPLVDELAEHAERGALFFDPPSLPVFKAIAGEWDGPHEAVKGFLGRQDFQFRF